MLEALKNLTMFTSFNSQRKPAFFSSNGRCILYTNAVDNWDKNQKIFLFLLFFHKLERRKLIIPVFLANFLKQVVGLKRSQKT